jgi:hypothetical protein
MDTKSRNATAVKVAESFRRQDPPAHYGRAGHVRAGAAGAQCFSVVGQCDRCLLRRLDIFHLLTSLTFRHKMRIPRKATTHSRVKTATQSG